MAQSVSYQKVGYPLPLYNFRVTVDSTAISFVEVSGIAVEYDNVTYRHGLSYLEGKTSRPSTAVRLSRFPVGAAPSWRQADLPYDWLSARDLRPMEISLCDEQGQAVFSWKIAAAVPVSLKALTFSASTTDVAIDTPELQAKGSPLPSRRETRWTQEREGDDEPDFGALFRIPFWCLFLRIGRDSEPTGYPLPQGQRIDQHGKDHADSGRRSEPVHAASAHRDRARESGPERGMVVGSPLNIEFNVAMSLFSSRHRTCW